MVRLHMGDHKIIHCTPCQGFIQVLQPLGGGAGVHGIHDSDLVVKDYIAVVGYAVRYDILALKKIDGRIVCADIAHRIGDGDILHLASSFEKLHSAGEAFV